MNYNYHTHTPYCSHASETPEEYINIAIENKIEYMGFSDHSPFVCQNGAQSLYRVPFEKGTLYCDEIKSLSLKYKDKIDIKVGFEMEYYPDDFKKMLKYAKEYGAEYLILGEHFLCDESISDYCTFSGMDDINILNQYANNVVEGIKSGVFTYVAHPDIIVFKGNIEDYKAAMRKICKASREYNIPLEINFLGIRGNRNYPDKEFFKIAAEEKSPITFGFDAHSAIDAYDGESLKTANKMVKELGLNYIGKPNLILIQDL